MERKLRQVRIDVLADRLGLPLRESDYAEFAVRATRFSLVHQRLLQKTDKAKVPLLQFLRLARAFPIGFSRRRRRHFHLAQPFAPKGRILLICTGFVDRFWTS